MFRPPVLAAIAFGLVVVGFNSSAPLCAADRPNILWITCEDISPNLGCYGDEYAHTPNLDRLATQGVRYTHAFAPIGVCAPARSCLVTGMYPPSIGTHHMRCRGTLPDEVRCFPEYLRKAGYYCTNNVKTDYNFAAPKESWDESSRQAHWRNRAEGQPFFAVFNFTTCHESQIRLPEKQYRQRTADYTDEERHDPAESPIPPYHPDTPEIRRDWARYADMITYMDRQVGELLAQLAADGLAENTIVFFFSDHGAGMPRSKRWLYDTSLRVPFIVRFPKAYEQHAPGRPGTTTDRLVSFVDFAPTVLSLAGVDIPAHMQGEAFLGAKAEKPREYVYGFRDRMDERYDMLRAVRGRRYKYIRNYAPHLPWFRHQHLNYAWEMPTLRVWQTLAEAGQLAGPQAIFMAERKPAEELYDTEADPYEVHNLADSSEHRAILERLRAKHQAWVFAIRDLGFLPESDLRSRFGRTPAYTAVRENPESYPLGALFAAADRATRPETSVAEWQTLHAAADPALRYWGAVGLGSRIEASDAAVAALTKLLEDPAPAVRVAAADGLCRYGRFEQAVPVLNAAMSDKNEWVRVQAVNVLDRIDEAARPALPEIERGLDDSNDYVVRVATHALEHFRPKAP